MKIKTVYIIAIIGIVSAVVSAILFIFENSWSNAVGIFSTIISIVLGMVSIIYTYVSGKETLDVLEQIKRQNSKLVDKINHELSKNNFNDANIKYIRDTIASDSGEQETK